MTTFQKIPASVEAIKIPEISVDSDPFDFPEKPAWFTRAVDLGWFRPTLTLDDKYWVYEVGASAQPEYAYPGYWLIEVVPLSIPRVAEDQVFKTIYEPLGTLHSEHNVLDSRYDEITMQKVYSAFMDNAVDEKVAIDVINHMQNEGILFRERA